MKTDDELVERIAFLLTVSEEAQLRTGDRRSTESARKTLKAGAKMAGVEISTSKESGFVTATVK